MVAVIDNIAVCERLWRRLVPTATLFDLWEVRLCFHEHYRYRPLFLVPGGASAPRGLLALSEIDEHGYRGCFPGETYHGRTWLESNRIVADSGDVAAALLAGCPRPAHLRYLTAESFPAPPPADAVDEVGYLFRPGDYDYSFERYFQRFSAKSRKKLTRELDDLAAGGLRFRHDDLRDADALFEMNLASFGERSYFADGRFLASFRALVRLLAERGWLRVTTVLAGERIAAVDVGAVYRNTYTLLAGATDPALPGIAKVINFHHLRWACERRLGLVDFLCGDFGWKRRFHLAARPLYQVRNDDDAATAIGRAEALSSRA